MEGAYGCVFRPALCGIGDEKMVSKAFDQSENLEDEYQIHQKMNLESIQNYKRYYITNPKKCHLNRPVMCKDKSFSLVLNYLDGGETLTKMLGSNSRSDPVQILNGLTNIFYGVMLMNNIKRYHLDIKPDNIVLDDTGQFRLIDFGFSKNLNLNTVSNPLYDLPYEYWPFEMSALNNFNGKISNKYLKGYLSILNDEFITLRKKEIVFDTDIFPLEIATEEMIYDKSDVWGLGLTLCKVYESSLGKTLSMRVRANLLDFIKKLLIFNPLDRPNAHEAYTMYTKLKFN